MPAFEKKRQGLNKIASTGNYNSVLGCKANELEEKIRELERELARANTSIERYKNLLAEVGRIQRSFLPSSPPYIEGYDIGAIMVPARKMGGDFYDFLPLPEGASRIGVVVGDVSGKGLEAALYMALTHGMLHAGLSFPLKMSPEQVGIWLDLQLKQVMEEEKSSEKEGGPSAFVAMTYGVLDAKKHSFDFTRAGNERPMLLDSDGKHLYKSNKIGQVLGMMEGVPMLDSDRLSIPVGGILALYTDGFPDQFDREQSHYGRERLHKIIADKRRLPAQEISDAVLRDNDAYRSGSRVHDDRTMLIIKRE